MARKLKNPHKGELEAAARSVMSKSNAVLDQKFADLKEVRKEQKQYESMLEKERDAAAKKSLKEAAKVAGADADRLRREIDMHFSRAIKDVEGVVKRVRAMPGAAAHKAHISKVHREVEAMKKPRKAFRDLRDRVRELRASGVTLEGMVKSAKAKTPKRKVVRPAKRGAVKIGHVSADAFSESYVLWAEAAESELMVALDAFTNRPTTKSYMALATLWKSASRQLMAIPGMKATKVVFDRMEGEGDTPGIADIIDGVNVDRGTARRLRRLYDDWKFIDVQLKTTNRRIMRGEPVTKTELRRIEIRLGSIFKLMKFESDIVTPAMARGDIREVRAEIKEAKDGDFLHSRSTQKFLLKKIEAMRAKYAAASKGWPMRDRKKISEDLGGLRAMVVVRSSAIQEAPRRKRKAQAKLALSPAKVTKARGRKSNPKRGMTFTKFAHWLNTPESETTSKAQKVDYLKSAAQWEDYGAVSPAEMREAKAIVSARSNPKKNPKKKAAKKVTKKKVAKKKKAAKRKTAKKPEWQRSISLCQKRWEHYCKRPSKKRLEAVYVHMDKMKESKSKKVAAERSKCMRVANSEAKKLKYKRK